MEDGTGLQHVSQQNLGLKEIRPLSSGCQPLLNNAARIGTIKLLTTLKNYSDML